MIDPINDELVLLSELASRLPRRPSSAALWRWHAKGINGVKLEVCRVGGRLYTTEAAFREFVQQTTAASARVHEGEAPESSNNPTSRPSGKKWRRKASRRRRSKGTDQQLANEGLK